MQPMMAVCRCISRTLSTWVWSAPAASISGFRAVDLIKIFYRFDIHPNTARHGLPHIPRKLSQPPGLSSWTRNTFLPLPCAILMPA